MPPTPMMQQYLQIKEQYPDAILFFRLGDFYEMFYQDAEIVSRELQLTLTGRQGGQGVKVPMCGVPYHAADPYIARLVERGYRVAICEQMEDAAESRGLVKRDIIRIITPGTWIPEADETMNHYIVSIIPGREAWGMALADLGTGEFLVSSIRGELGLAYLHEELAARCPAEGLWPEEQEVPDTIREQVRCWTRRSPADYHYRNSEELLCRHFQVADLRSLGLEELPQAVQAAGCLLAYLYETQKVSLRQFTRIEILEPGGVMRLDAATRRSLELTRRVQDGLERGTLLSVLDRTATSMGKRCMRNWVDFPLTDYGQITRRLDAVQEWVQDTVTVLTLADALNEVYDLERLGARIGMGTANARDLVALMRSLQRLPGIRQILGQCTSSYLKQLHEAIHELPQLTLLLAEAIEEQPPASLHEGGLIRSGFDPEIDRLRMARTHGRRWIADLERAERERTGIRSLKIGYNKVFGYYIEVTRANLSLVPEDYIRKQTLANAERFVTRELKEQEELILEADQKLIRLEYDTFIRIRDQVAAHSVALKETAAAIGQVDALLSLARVASEQRFVRPEIHLEPSLDIQQGRHPVLEKTMPSGRFVPNNLRLGEQDGTIAIITGPNMAGKSTFARQTALIVLMAQMGSFVPASSAAIGIADRIFSRMGASDDISGGLSTFMVEMTEVANILRHASRQSLIILDEVGRGTSTYDGMSIAGAIVEYIHDRIGARTLFTTHYHELTEMAELLPGVRNFTVAVKEDKDEITFLRQVIPGCADKSYGIHVARLAGLPAPVIARARQRLQVLESGTSMGNMAAAAQIELPLPVGNPGLLASRHLEEEIIRRLKDLQVMDMTPLEVASHVHAWQRELELTSRSDSSKGSPQNA